MLPAASLPSFLLSTTRLFCFLSNNQVDLPKERICDAVRTGLCHFSLPSLSEELSYLQITFFAEAPALLLSPLAGVIVDRYDRKKVQRLSFSRFLSFSSQCQ
jgi:hypothetical protein